MKMSNRTFYFRLFSIILFLLILGCAAGPKLTKVTSLVPLSDADKKATKSGVTVEVTPINFTNLATYPELGTMAKIATLAFLETEPTLKTKPIPNVLFGETFAIKITNNTGHIIRMESSDIGLTVQNQDIRKLNKEGILQLWAVYIPSQFEYQRTVPIEITSAVTRIPYWDESLKVLPGKSIQAYAAFEVRLQEGFGQATMAIYDLVTNTDTAGNPTERTNFDFSFKEFTSTVTTK